MKRLIYLLCMILIATILTGCGGSSKEMDSNKVVIYSSMEDYRNDYYLQKLKEKFPQYNIVLEYIPTGRQAAKLKAEGTKTECDISLDLDYAYSEQLKDNFAKADLKTDHYAEDILSQDGRYLPGCRVSGAIIVNNALLKEKKLPVPTSYQDLIRLEYKGLVSMANPKSSGTGYIFVKSLVNAWGEDKALAYFDELSKNILQFTSSGSGPVKALVTKEAAIALGMTAQGVLEINKGNDFSVIFFKEGAPYTAYATAVIKGKENREAVKNVYKYINETLVEDNTRLFFPEKMYKNKDFKVKNYPEKVPYADMNNNTIQEKERLLAKWKY